MIADKIKRMLPYRLKEILRRVREIMRTIYYEPQYRRSIRILSSKPKNNVIEVAIFSTDPTVWNSFETVYKCMKESSKINVTVYMLPVNEESEYDALQKFFRDRGIDAVKIYDYKSGKYIPFESVKADYILYDSPYEAPQNFDMSKMFKRAKICYIPYGYTLSDSVILYTTVMPERTFRFMYAFFAPWEFPASYAEKLYDRISSRKYHHVLRYGYPRFDIIAELLNKQPPKDSDKFTVLWNPRFAFKDDNKGEPANTNTFFEFREKITGRAASHTDEYWIVRPHPSAFFWYVSRGKMTQNEVDEYISSLDENPRAELDRNKDYLDAFMRSDAMLADFSSILIEYAAFGKPIIYCGNHEAIPYDEMLEAMYLPKSWDEAMAIIENLKKGIDPLAEKRRNFAEKVLSGGRSGERITQFIIDDYTAI